MCMNDSKSDAGDPQAVVTIGPNAKQKARRSFWRPIQKRDGLKAVPYSLTRPAKAGHYVSLLFAFLLLEHDAAVSDDRATVDRHLDIGSVVGGRAHFRNAFE